MVFISTCLWLSQDVLTVFYKAGKRIQDQIKSRIVISKKLLITRNLFTTRVSKAKLEALDCAFVYVGQLQYYVVSELRGERITS